jgi:hypothetical protein
LLNHTPHGEVPLDICTSRIEEAIRLAAQRFANEEFRSLECGIRFSQSERDEDGINEGCGHVCRAGHASDEALALWRKLDKEGRL